MRPLLPALVLVLAGCRPAVPSPAALAPTHAGSGEGSGEGSGALARWSYTIAIDEQLARMQLGLCVDGPRPRRLIAGDEAIGFVRSARVRGGPALAREGRGFAVETLGEHGCVDLEIDLDAAVGASGRDSGRSGETMLLAPDRWLWYPAVVPDPLEARARFELPPGIAATVPWPAIDVVGTGDEAPHDWRVLDRTSFGWNAWIAFGRYRPLELEAAGCEFEIAVLDGPRQASDAGIEAWIRAAAEAGAQLYGRFPRDRVSVVVIPTPSWGDTPVLFGMARRGGGGSVMLLLNDAVDDAALPGEWVAVHELLHLGMPLVAEPWMSEGFVTYYSHVLRARAGLLDTDEVDAAAQARRALTILAGGFEDRPSARTLASASEDMHQLGGYRRVYWGGAALAFAIDLELRRASGNRRSLDDLMIDLWPLADERRRFAADELLARMDAQTAAWLAAGELDRPVSPSAIADRHLRAHATPEEIQRLRGIAVEVDDGRVRLLADPNDEVRARDALFAPR